MEINLGATAEATANIIELLAAIAALVPLTFGAAERIHGWRKRRLEARDYDPLRQRTADRSDP